MHISPHTFDDLMRTALGDDGVWDRLVDDPDSYDQLRTWLKAMIQDIDHQLAYRRDDLEELSLTEDPDVVRQTKVDYYRWRKKALHLKYLCERRNRDLGRLRSRRSDDAADYKAIMVDLADAVTAHQHGDIDDQELHAELDELILPGPQKMTLREYLELLDTGEDDQSA